ncbi:uncharacterized protein V6R79_007530 [Siganus canaliculatus]
MPSRLPGHCHSWILAAINLHPMEQSSSVLLTNQSSGRASYKSEACELRYVGGVTAVRSEECIQTAGFTFSSLLNWTLGTNKHSVMVDYARVSCPTAKIEDTF